MSVFSDDSPPEGPLDAYHNKLETTPNTIGAAIAYDILLLVSPAQITTVLLVILRSSLCRTEPEKPGVKQVALSIKVQVASKDPEKFVYTDDPKA
ncbi:hypothetical protein LTR56_007144 [Elasticomyces elasticus]|nr:hypothetical protein LTR22_020435 [Elasticomyces elasticus]KAK3649012.1 hypothetical protein LTR56_007144 [Elasticomyces elasticus]KAK4917788.1 hypothetical protein LTR49_014325 [Elasticomyces elasticus]KAK5740458.1 hypothetical protein LTS12_024946 [Elasticomyces elasticus]